MVPSAGSRYWFVCFQGLAAYFFFWGQFYNPVVFSALFLKAEDVFFQAFLMMFKADSKPWQTLAAIGWLFKKQVNLMHFFRQHGNGQNGHHE